MPQGAYGLPACPREGRGVSGARPAFTTGKRPAAVLFDCDGVLADTEALASLIVAEDLQARGWAVTPEECQAIFLGRAVPDMVPIVEARLGPLPAGWMQHIAGRLAWRMAREAVPIPGALDTVRTLAAAGMPLACASNSSRAELRGKLARLGLAAVFGDRVFSYEDVARPKPAPDIYLAAAEACAARPLDCVVVEDSLTGIRAGIAAGCQVLAYAGALDPAPLEAQGARAFRRMEDLPALLGLG
jgi:HAD superfamily hydrolase (TIGR01509 family)